jgi:hypothetical protein
MSDKTVLARCYKKHNFIGTTSTVPNPSWYGGTTTTISEKCPHCGGFGGSPVDIQNVPLDTTCQTLDVYMFTDGSRQGNSQRIANQRPNKILDLLDKYGFIYDTTGNSSMWEIVFKRNLNVTNEYAVFYPSCQTQTSKLAIVSNDVKFVKELETLVRDARKNYKLAHPTIKKKVITKITFSDILGNPLEIGQYVAYSKFGRLNIGKITKFSPKQVTVSDVRSKGVNYVYSSETCRINENDMLLYLLTK